MIEKVPVILYLVRSKSYPQHAILCTEIHLKKWVNRILDKGEEPEYESITPSQLERIIAPNPHLN